MNKIQEEIDSLITLAEFLKLVPEKYTKRLTIRCRKDYSKERMVFDVLFNFCNIRHKKEDRFINVIKMTFEETASGNFCTFWNKGERETINKAIERLKEVME